MAERKRRDPDRAIAGKGETVKVWTLLENTACREDIRAEHGLSLYIETGSHRILFDMGQSDAFAENAEKLGVDLSRVDMAVLSHGHYDHGGGLGRFLEINHTAPVYLNRDAFAPHYNAAEKYIGLDPALKGREQLVFVEEKREIGPGMTLYTCNGWDRVCPVDPAGLKLLADGQLCPEDFRHEQYLLIEEAGKRILFSGCSHKGIRNIVHWFRPDVLVGGFHFMKLDTAGAGTETLEEAARDLLAFPAVYYTGHCTGEQQYAFLKERMGEQLQSLSGGMTVEI